MRDERAFKRMNESADPSVEIGLLSGWKPQLGLWGEGRKDEEGHVLVDTGRQWRASWEQAGTLTAWLDFRPCHTANWGPLQPAQRTRNDEPQLFRLALIFSNYKNNTYLLTKKEKTLQLLPMSFRVKATGPRSCPQCLPPLSTPSPLLACPLIHASLATVTALLFRH